MKSRNITTKEILVTVLACTCFDFSVIGMDKTADAKKATLTPKEQQEQECELRHFSNGYKSHYIRNNEEAKKLAVNGGSFQALWITKEITVPLDLSKCKNLEQLVIEGDIRGSLDLSKYRNLHYLLISGNIKGSLNLPSNLLLLGILGELSGTIIFPTEKGQVFRKVLIGSYAEIINRLDLSNYSLGELVILGKLNGGIVPPENLPKVVVSRNAEIAGGLDLSHCAKLEKMEIKKGLEGILTLPQNVDIKDAYEVVHGGNNISWSADCNYEPYVIQNNEEAEKLALNGGSLRALRITKEITVPLDLSKCANLGKLIVEGNIGGSLDLSKCENLKRLVIEGNIGGSLDLSKCKKLAYLQITGDIKGSLNLPSNLLLLGILGELSGTIIFPTEKPIIAREVFISDNAKIINRLDLSNCSIEELRICGKLNGGIVPSVDLERVTVAAKNAEIAGGLDLSHCAKLERVIIRKELEGILTLPQNVKIKDRYEVTGNIGLVF